MSEAASPGYLASVDSNLCRLWMKYTSKHLKHNLLYEYLINQQRNPPKGEEEPKNCDLAEAVRTDYTLEAQRPPPLRRPEPYVLPCLCSRYSARHIVRPAGGGGRVCLAVASQPSQPIITVSHVSRPRQPGAPGRK